MSTVISHIHDRPRLMVTVDVFADIYIDAAWMEFEGGSSLVKGRVRVDVAQVEQLIDALKTARKRIRSGDA